MDEATLRQIVTEVVQEHVTSVREDVASVREDVASVREDVAAVREDVASVREDVASVREELRSVEQRLVEASQAQFRQTAELYRGLSQKIDAITAQMGEQGGRTRGAIEALRASIENQDFRADQIQRQLDQLELDVRKPGS